MFARVCEKVKASGMDAFLIQHVPNVNWLCNKENYYLPAVLLIFPADRAGADMVHIFTMSRNIEAFRELYAECTVLRGGLADALNLCRERGVKRLGFEANTLAWQAAQDLSAQAAGCGMELAPLADFVEDLRMVKTPEEIELLQAAVRLSDDAYLEFLNHLKVGMSELQAKNTLRRILFDHGAEDLSFDILISSGERTFLPHSASTERVLRQGDLVLMDFGIVLNGYCSDMTRTVVMGRGDELQKSRYALVLKAQLAALQGIRAGITLSEADALARNVITAEMDQGCFDYGLGHGIGRLVHEKPRMHPAHGAPMVAGNVVSVEPGLYLKGWGGIRIEDLLVVGETCPGRNLTASPKESLLEI